MQLADCEKIKKNNPSAPPSYRQRIYYDRKKLVISTDFHRMESLQLKETASGYSIIVPIDSWTRQQLNNLESFTMKSVKIPQDLMSTWKVDGNSATAFKPFWHGSVMTINVSKWCKLFINSMEHGDLADCQSLLKSGSYQFEIEFPYIYFGQHRNNYLCSTASRVVKVNLQTPHPPIKLLNDFDKLLEDISAEPPKKKKRGPKRKSTTDDEKL